MHGFANQVLARRAALLTRIDSLWAGVCPYTKIRVHGDYHLGQVLCVGDDFVSIDFEGEPARPLVERRAKQSPLRDVAGMLRSLSYAAETGLRAATGEHASRARLAAWARGWESWTSASFVEGYLHAAGAAVFVRPIRTSCRALDLLKLHKALYALHYEMNNRPSWVALPLRGILEMLESGAR
jgi:trehalose synthase-fused probable maltokinase